MRNFDRFYEFTFFDVNEDNSISNIENFKISNTVNFTFSYNIIPGAFNTATFTFYNISNNTVNLFAGKNNRRGFYFRACYASEINLSLSTIFRGLTYRVNSYREGPNILTEVTAGDAFFNLQQATIRTLNFTNVPVAAVDIVQKIQEYLGVFNIFSGAQYLSTKPEYNHPITYSNISVVDVLDQITRDNSCTWGYDLAGIKISPLPNNPSYSQPEPQYVFNSGNAAISNDTPLISASTGLIGNVKAENLSIQLFPVDYLGVKRLANNHPFVTATILLRPIPLFSTINLQCEITDLNGLYRVFSVNYNGEYRGEDWFSNLKLSPIVSK